MQKGKGERIGIFNTRYVVPDAFPALVLSDDVLLLACLNTAGINSLWSLPDHVLPLACLLA